MLICFASGVADKVCVPHIACIFRQPYFAKLSLKQWADMPLEELAAVCRISSK
jgi:hypothetical protein